MGLVSLAVDDADARPKAKELAQNLASGPTASLRLVRRLHWKCTNNRYEKQLPTSTARCPAHPGRHP